MEFGDGVVQILHILCRYFLYQSKDCTNTTYVSSCKTWRDGYGAVAVLNQSMPWNAAQVLGHVRGWEKNSALILPEAACFVKGRHVIRFIRDF